MVGMHWWNALWMVQGPISQRLQDNGTQSYATTHDISGLVAVLVLVIITIVRILFLLVHVLTIIPVWVKYTYRFTLARPFHCKQSINFSSKIPRLDFLPPSEEG